MEKSWSRIKSGKQFTFFQTNNSHKIDFILLSNQMKFLFFLVSDQITRASWERQSNIHIYVKYYCYVMTASIKIWTEAWSFESRKLNFPSTISVLLTWKIIWQFFFFLLRRQLNNHWKQITAFVNMNKTIFSPSINTIVNKRSWLRTIIIKSFGKFVLSGTHINSFEKWLSCVIKVNEIMFYENVRVSSKTSHKWQKPVSHKWSLNFCHFQ